MPPTAVAPGPFDGAGRTGHDAGRTEHAFARASCPAAGQGREHHGAGPVCNRNRVPVGDCHDGLWGQVAVRPPNLVRVAWEPAAPVHCPPWWPRAPTTLLWDARRRGRSLDGVLQRVAGLPVGVVPAQARTGERAGPLILPKAEVTGEAGSGWALPCVPIGILSIPPVGAGVCIEFEQGAPGRPVCLGSLWNSPADTARLSLARLHASGDQDQRKRSAGAASWSCQPANRGKRPAPAGSPSIRCSPDYPAATSALAAEGRQPEPLTESGPSPPAPDARHDPLPGSRVKDASGRAGAARPFDPPTRSQNPAAIRDREESGHPKTGQLRLHNPFGPGR
jgi:hypothetical protein